MCQYQSCCVSRSLAILGAGLLITFSGNTAMSGSTTPSSSLNRIGLLFTMLLMATIASADCKKNLRGDVFCGAGQCLVDKDGTVWCSRHYEGGAALTLGGKVLCGKGQCAKDRHGQIFCSSKIGGAALVDSHGRVRCYGECEPATVDNCESTRADTASGEDS